MDTLDIDFEGSNVQEPPTGNETQPANTEGNPANTDDVTHLNGNDVDDITGKDGSQTNNHTQPEGDNKTGNTDDNPSTGELNVGDSLEIDGATYTVAENGDIVDEKGNVFKEAKDVAKWLESVNVDDSAPDEGLSISAIQEAIGVQVTDEDGKPVEFTNDAAGYKAYVDAVMELKSKDIREAAINTLYAENPLLKQFQDYVQLTGTPRGFGELPDRSGIEVEKDNEAQQIAIIRMAATEFGNKSLNDNYLKYLRDTGGLYEEAKTQLEALVEKDKAVRTEIEKRAKEAREKEAEDNKAYWTKINQIVSGRVISGYKLPESFTKEVNGTKIVVTPKDFFNYLSNPAYDGEDGRKITGYQRDLANMADDDYLNKELLDAWLLFTGGTVKDLISMAAKEDKVRQLKIKSKEQRAMKTVRIVKKAKDKADINDIVLG